VSEKKPKVPKRFDLSELQFTLASDEKTLSEIDEAQSKAIQAAQKMRRFAWR
jgi:hypothetical protein